MDVVYECFERKVEKMRMNQRHLSGKQSTLTFLHVIWLHYTVHLAEA